jgi:hypothetical protein
MDYNPLASTFACVHLYFAALMHKISTGVNVVYFCNYRPVAMLVPLT